MLLLSLVACSDYGFNGDDDAAAGTACVLDLCEDEPIGEPYAVGTDDECIFDPGPGSFDPIVEWEWNGNDVSVGYDDAMMQPVVGDVDGDGMPEVLVTTYTGTDYNGPGALNVLSGDGAGIEASWTSVGGHLPFATAGLALADLEGDGVVEILFASIEQRVVAMHADGSVVFASEPGSSSRPALAVADMDGDGLAEVVSGRDIYDHTGQLRGQGCCSTGWGVPIVVDLDVDGELEVVTPSHAYAVDGSTVWANGLLASDGASWLDGYTAVGDFDADGQGEVVVSDHANVVLLESDGSLVWGPVAVPGGGGGPPTVADFDGDGAPEIGVAGASSYVVLETDGSLLWSHAIQDYSSAQTGSSVFDFEGDGASEVLYADETTFWVLDGATGAPLIADEAHASWTVIEYPVVVDVDADGEAEIVVASNDSTSAGRQGITVIGDANQSWAQTARVWNQHAYHITNVEDDLRVPAHPTMNWLTGHNSFRAGGLREGPKNPAPDLRAALDRVCLTCDDARIVAFVENAGSGPASDVDVALYVRDAAGARRLLETEVVWGEIAAGASSDALVLYPRPDALVGAVALELEVDATGTIAECDDANNVAQLDVEPCAP